MILTLPVSEVYQTVFECLYTLLTRTSSYWITVYQKQVSLTINPNYEELPLFEKIRRNGLHYYRFSRWQNLNHGIFTRQGGASQSPWHGLNVGGTVGDDVTVVHENHRLMYETLGVNRERACTTWQVHGADVVMVHGPVQGRRWVAKADGMVTNRPDTPLVMRYADCVPLLFYDPVQEVIGLAHAGWRGTVKGMAANMVQAMIQGYGCRPSDIQTGIGPSIAGCCFQVGEEVVDAVQAYFGTLDGLMRRDPDDGTAYVDLWAANRLALERAGVQQIDVIDICTYEHTDEFFSHRAEKGKTGRFGVVVTL